jgi:hypothetical protein
MVVDPCYVLPDKAEKGQILSHHNPQYTYEKLMEDLFEGEKPTQTKQITFANKFGIGVVVSSGYGDGVYPVYVKEEDGRVKELKISFF